MGVGASLAMESLRYNQPACRTLGSQTSHPIICPDKEAHYGLNPEPLSATSATFALVL